MATINYEKKYKTLVESVKTLKEANPSDEGIQNWIKDNVPELAESEDEKIKEELMQYLWDLYHKDFCPPKPTIDTCDKWLAWLEKQGQVNESPISQHENKTCKENDDSLTSEDEKIRKDIIWCIKHSGIKESNPINPHVTTIVKDAIAWLEKQGQTFTKKDVDDAYLKGISDAKNELEKQAQKPNNKVDLATKSYITPNSKFFQFIYDRLVYVHHENPDVDYMLSLKERIEDMEKPVDKVEQSSFK